MTRIPTQAKNMAIIAISDSNYASRCATLIESAAIEFDATVLALDSQVMALQEHMPNLRVESFDTFLRQNAKISQIIENRSPVEKIFSVGPSFLLRQAKDLRADGWLVYADSDLFFFEPLKEYLDRFPSCNVVIAPHRHLPWNRRRLGKYGKYNVGLVAFRNNKEGLRALSFWAKSCLEWCYDTPQDGKYADQKYLESFPYISDGVFIDGSLGANFAPWNSFLKRLTINHDGDIYVSGDKLTYFHAQGIKFRNRRWVLGHLNYFSFASRKLKRLIYIPYLRKVEHWNRKIGLQFPGTLRLPTSALGAIASSVIYLFSLISGQTVKVGVEKTGAQK